MVGKENGTVRQCKIDGQADAQRPEPYNDPKVLKDLYHGRKLSISKIADMLEVCSSTIHNKMKLHNIPRRGSGPLKERFHLHYDEKGADECWLWMNGDLRENTTTPTIWDDTLEKYRHVNRVAYELEYEELPHNKRIQHTCGERLCVNPNHLEPTRAIKNEDK